MKMNFPFTYRYGFVVWALLGFTTSVLGVVYPIEIFTDNGGYYNDPDLIFTVNVFESGPLVSFKFENNSTIPSSITDIYFDGASSLQTASLIDADDGIGGHPGVDFSLGTSPQNLPGGENLIPPFTKPPEFSIDSDPGQYGTAIHGINPDEWLTINYHLHLGHFFNDVISELNTGNLRIGIHIQALPNGSSESGVNVPEPTTFCLLVSSILFMRRKHFRRKANRP